MKKIKIIIPILIILFIPVRIYVVNNYRIDNNLEKLIKIKKGLIVSDLKVINTQEQENYIEYKNIKIGKIFSEIDCVDKNNSYICEFGDRIITIGLTNSLIEDYQEYTNKKLDLNDDLALLGMIKESYNEPSFFTSVSKLRSEFTLNMFAINYLPIIKSVDLIEGDLKGLLFYENDSFRELYLYKNNKTYKITFKNIDDNTIIELIKSIKID